ncbi:MAG: hypothetical protein IJE97_05245 [Thermoguttaceae bacterium]|nr:hypothetical protein [Thermoguttaceae bacterium]
MSDKCDKCGATTRWYEEKCPRCGAALTVALPTTPIALPHFSPSVSRREQTAVETPKQEAPTTETPKQETPTTETPKQEKPTTETPKQETPTTETPKQETPTTETEKKPQNPTAEKKSTKKTTFQRRLTALKRIVGVWRAAVAPETSSVATPRDRTLRYALGVALELVVCPPCAILAAYFFTRALLADRQADYHQALREAERARLALVAGVGVFAAGLCAFIFYVQSQEIREPLNDVPNSNIFKR